VDQTVQQQKAALRRQLRELTRGLSPAEREAASARARALLATQAPWRQARAVLFYAPQPDELDLWPLLLEALDEGRQIALPRYLPQAGAYGAALVADPARDLAPGKLGILEPGPHCPAFPLNRLDLVLAPGVGFDPHGRRLGRGKGYYDRLLAQVGALRCGVALDRQIVPALPAEPHDQMLDCILTPTRWLVCAQRAARP
jgi:5-formyltetrahydrofolate cyclo-ligase